MKSLINVFITAALLFMASTTFAGALPNFTIKPEGAKTFALYLEEIKSEWLRIRIQDENGFRLFDEEVAKAGSSFAKKYNLANLPDGLYSLEIEDQFTVKHQPIQVKNNALVIRNEGLKVIYKPVFSVKGQHLNLNFLQLEQATTAIEITDALGYVLYSELVAEPGSIQRQFNTGQLNNGVYALTVSVNGRSFTAEVTIKDGLRGVGLLSANAPATF